MFKDYVDARDWLESFIPLVYGKGELGLARIENLLKLLGNPQKKFKSILVGGTAGKGSTAYYIARLLQYSKFQIPNPKSQINSKGQKSTKVGLHVSPHLIYIGERMQILDNKKHFGTQGKQETRNKKQKEDNAIPVKRLVGLVNEIKPVIDDIKSKQPELTPSYFEILVALSFLYFAKEKVDYAVVEVGLGGRLDATNILTPEICVITNVGLDHTELLGNTIEKIAKEKAGIIKTRNKKQETRNKKLYGVLVVTGATGKALKVIEKIARLASATVIELKLFNVSESKRAKSNNAVLIKYSTLSQENVPETDIEKYIARHYYRLRCKGQTFAVFNKNMALLTVLALMSLRGAKGRSNLDKDEIATSYKAGLAMTLDREAVKKAFSVGFPGRFEEIDDGVIVDGAHNTDKMKALIDFVRNSKLKTQNSKITLVVAFKKGKNWKEMIDLLIKDLPVKEIIATQYFATTDMGKGSAVDPEEIAEYVASSKYRVSSIRTIQNSQEAVIEAIGYNVIARSEATKQSDKEIAASLDSLETRNDKTLVLVTGSLYLVGEARTLWKLPEF